MVEAGQRRRVLVLEDSVLVALALEAALADHGFEAIVAGSLAAAEERIGQVPPVAALLDLHLPDGNALALAERLDAQGCKVALCSGMDTATVPPGMDNEAVFLGAVEMFQRLGYLGMNPAPIRFCHRVI